SLVMGIGHDSESSELSASQIRQAIDDEIARYSRYIIELKTRRIHSHLAIFLHMAEWRRGHPPQIGSLGTAGSGLPVCKHWRAVALGCHASSELMGALLERSQRTSLSKSAIRLVLSHLARIRVLSITTPIANCDTSVFQLLDGPALDSNHSSSGVTAISAYASSRTHNLRRLELHTFLLRFSQISLPRLTHLTISQVSRYDTYPTPDTLLETLTRIPLLEELVIERAFPRPHQGIFPASTTAALPHLQYLRIGEYEAPITSLSKALAMKMRSLGTLRTLTVDMWSKRLCACTEDIDRASGAPQILDRDGTIHYTPNFDLRLEWSPTAKPAEDLFTKLFQLAPIRKVRCLFVGSLSTQLWLVLSRHTRQVSQLYHRPQWSNDTLPKRATMESVYVDRLLDCFIERYEAGAEIKKLRVLHPCNFTSADLDRLKEVVRCVEWDGSSSDLKE
ncbi:uncharacterized protein B0H18DRAFT_975034, partial [Fomitopsis serialis]|uniref:uncharacterized protein n=1 Tax=Fomitopsis serialis TaxID=139415 RepID=UPI002008C3AB